LSEYIDSFINQDWDSLAIDDGSFVVSANSYRARLEDRNGNVIYSTVDSISYRPEINTAPSITVDVEPKTELENTDFLNGILDVFVDGEILFSGEIEKISFNQEEGEFYSIKAYSPGRKLKQEVVSESANNRILSDYIAKTVDKFNEFDDEHFNLTDSSQENLTNVEKFGFSGRRPTNTSGTAKYTNVASDASQVEAIYVKVFSGSNNVEVVVDTANSSYSETINDADTGDFGEWRKVVPSGLNQESYDLIFNLNGSDTELYDWISLTEQELQRVNEAFAEPNVQDTVTVEDVNSDSGLESYINISETDPLEISSGLNLKSSTIYQILDDSPAAVWDDAQAETFNLQDNAESEIVHYFDRKPFEVIDDNVYVDSNGFAYEGRHIDPANVKGKVELEDGRNIVVNVNDEVVTPDSPNQQGSVDIVRDSDVTGLISTSSGIQTTDGQPVFEDGTSIDLGYAINLATFEDDGSTETNVRERFTPNENAFSVQDVSKADFAEWEFSPNYTIPDGNLGIAIRGRQEEFNMEGLSLTIDGQGIGKTEFNTIGISPNETDFDWYQNEAVFSEISADNTYTFRMEQNEDRITTDIDTVVFYDTRFSYNFPADVNSNNKLPGPESYPDLFSTTTSKLAVTGNIDSVDANITINNSVGNKLQVSFDSTNFFPDDGTEIGTTSISVSANVPTKTFELKFGLSRYGSRTNGTPTQGYLSQNLTEFDASADINDLQVIETKTFDENRLSIISNLADDSTLVFRWEGNNCRIFERGEKKTNVSLKSENVTSSVDIEDTYSSVEVQGVNNVTSGVIEANNAPAFINDHKLIRDRDVETVDDAARRAKAFLDKNSEIQYKGGIDTLPTRIPVGEQIDGSNFLHGQDVIIESGRYSKSRTSLSLGRNKSFARKFVDLDRSSDSSSKLDTS